MKRNAISSKTGSAIITALGLGFILMIAIAALQTFSSQRVRFTTMETRNFMALGLAEAGLNLIQTEMRLNPGFSTHSTSKSGDAFTWSSKVSAAPGVNDETASPHKLAVTMGSNGAYEGTLGDGKFKVRCGLMECADDPATENINESKCFYKVEALGKINNTVRRVEAVVQRRFIGREFLLYSGGSLSMVYGLTSDQGYNVFSKGHLYGHSVVEAGRILSRKQSPIGGGGTNQKFEDIELIKCGEGGIFLYSKMDFTFRDGQNFPQMAPTFPTFSNFTFARQGAGEAAYGEIPDQMYKKFPPIPENLQKYLVDGSKGNGGIKATAINFGKYKNDAQNGGIVVAATTNYPLPAGFPASSKGANDSTDKVEILDFGNKATGRPAGPNTNPGNGIIYSPNSLVIKGNPEKDLYIIAEGNIYVAGDFNQGGDPSRPEDKYGLAQNYKNDPMVRFQDSWNYLGWNKADNPSPTDPAVRLANDTGKTIRKFAMVVARERLVYDYRNPLDCFENELYPLVKARLAFIFSGAQGQEMTCLEKKVYELPQGGNQPLSINLTSPDGATGFADRLKKNLFTKDDAKNFQCKIFDETETTWTAVVDKGRDIYTQCQGSGNILDEEKLDRLTVEVMNALREKFKANPQNAGFEGLVGCLIHAVDFIGFNNTKFNNDYFFYPEMTTNGIFVSGAKRNQIFYMGPDVAKWFDEIGNTKTAVGRRHAGPIKVVASPAPAQSDEPEDGSEPPPPPPAPGVAHSGFIHRMFGSEVRLEDTEVKRITSQFCPYSPPLRRKIYDYGLPQLATNFRDASSLTDGEVSAFVLLTWKDGAGTEAEFTSF